MDPNNQNPNQVYSSPDILPTGISTDPTPIPPTTPNISSPYVSNQENKDASGKIMHEIPRRSKLFAVIVIIALMLLALGSLGYWGYLYYFSITEPVATIAPQVELVPTPTPDPTANWKTYTNEKYKFSFKYPDKLSGTVGSVAPPYTGTSVPIRTFSDLNTIKEGTDAPFDGFSLYVVTNMKAANFDGYLKNEKTAMDSSLMTFMANAIRDDFANGSAYINRNRGYFYLPSNDNKYVVVFASIGETSAFQETVRQILSTFKFLDKIPTSAIKLSNNTDKPNLYLILPDKAVVKGQEVTINGSTYEISTFVGPGLCKMDDSKCTYTDEKTDRWQIFRVWTQNGQVFALNPQNGRLNNILSDGMTITKKLKSAIFNQSEVGLWKELIDNLKVI